VFANHVRGIELSRSDPPAIAPSLFQYFCIPATASFKFPSSCAVGLPFSASSENPRTRDRWAHNIRLGRRAAEAVSAVDILPTIISDHHFVLSRLHFVGWERRSRPAEDAAKLPYNLIH